eukprot:scaffold156546_cov17-Prasinocladus_malaysianus.AAC.4
MSTSEERSVSIGRQSRYHTCPHKRETLPIFLGVDARDGHGSLGGTSRTLGNVRKRRHGLAA